MSHVAAASNVKEITVKSVLLGIILGFIFTIGNAYLGLKVGITVSASIPAAVISMAILKVISRRTTILENNVVQTIASTGSSLAAGIIFTVPALIFLGAPPSQLNIFLIAILGGLLGVLLMIPLRHHFMVEEHTNLPYPEGTACAEVLKVREDSGRGAMLVVWGLIIGIADRVLMSMVRLYPETATWRIGTTRVSVDTTPALLGVGTIIGLRYSLVMFAGGALAWWALIPLLQSARETPIDPQLIWSETVRYIGVGAVALGGFVSLVRLAPTIGRSLKGHFVTLFKDPFHKPEKLRTERDLSFTWVAGGTVVVLLLLYLLPELNLNLLTIAMTLIFSFFFVALTSITVGLIGCSSSPVSGMMISTLLVICLVFLGLGWVGRVYLIMAMVAGSVVGVATTIASDTSQDLKTGYLVGATPQAQQIVTVIGVIVGALIIGWVVMLLNNTYKLGSDALPAPQATLMSLIVKGVINKSLPFTLVGIGIMIGISVELLNIRALPFALGIYLPLSTSLPIAVGGLLSWIIQRLSKGRGAEEQMILLGSGVIAGDALTGVFIALSAVIGWTSVSGPSIFDHWVSLGAYIAFAVIFILFSLRRISTPPTLQP